jgi:hypothetical protein
LREDRPIKISSFPTSAANKRYWHDRALEAERQISNAINPELRAVYLALLVHYRRMEETYGGTSRRPAIAATNVESP